jgi:signal-transduction protein with cAMP-binding, CBS, and nucleotidyltransferase domain
MNMQACQCHTLPVTHAGQIVGVLTMDNVGEFLAIQSALRPERGRASRI